MIEGAVNAAYEAEVTLSLQGPEGRSRDIKAVIDTGYTGVLTLPSAVVADLGLPFSHIGWAFLANDDVVSFDVHDVTILWDGQPKHVKADAMGGTPLVGMLLLDGYDLNIRVQEDGRVLIQAWA